MIVYVIRRLEYLEVLENKKRRINEFVQKNQRKLTACYVRICSEININICGRNRCLEERMIDGDEDEID